MFKRLRKASSPYFLFLVGMWSGGYRISVRRSFKHQLYIMYKCIDIKVYIGQFISLGQQGHPSIHHSQIRDTSNYYRNSQEVLFTLSSTRIPKESVHSRVYIISPAPLIEFRIRDASSGHGSPRRQVGNQSLLEGERALCVQIYTGLTLPHPECQLHSTAYQAKG